MTVNLAEFMKVFTIVFTMSSMILLFRHLIVNYDESDEKQPEKLDDHIDINFNTSTPDIIDYDGMGNQGRFPIANKGMKK